MGYESALTAAGAVVKCFESFGSYQGDWWAKVVYQGNEFWISGTFGSCSYCDSFDSEFGNSDFELCDEHKYTYDNDAITQCQDCKNSGEEYNKRLADFGRTYLDGGFTQEEAIAMASRNLEWDSDATSMVEFIKNNA